MVSHHVPRVFLLLALPPMAADVELGASEHSCDACQEEFRSHAPVIFLQW